MLNRMVPIPHPYLYHTWKNRQNNFCIFFKISDFFSKTVKKSREKNPAGGLYPLGSTFNAKSNGTNPLLVSLLYVEKSTKQFFVFFSKFSIFFKNHQKKSGKTPAWGALPPRKYIQCWIEWYQPPTRIFTIREEIDKTIFVFFFQIFRFFSKTIKKSRENKKPSVGGYTP